MMMAIALFAVSLYHALVMVLYGNDNVPEQACPMFSLFSVSLTIVTGIVYYYAVKSTQCCIHGILFIGSGHRQRYSATSPYDEEVELQVRVCMQRDTDGCIADIHSLELGTRQRFPWSRMSRRKFGALCQSRK